MQWHVTTYAVVTMATALCAGALFIPAWRRRGNPGGLALALLMLAVAAWGLAQGLEAAAVGVSNKVFWSAISYLGTHSTPVFFLLFVLDYTNKSLGLIGGRRALLLWIIPATTVILALTNEWHHLVWTGFTPIAGADNLILYEHGAWFWFSLVWAYGVLVVATQCLVVAALRYAGLYRLQTLLLLAAVPLPWLSNILYIFRLGPFPGQDLTPVAFTLSGLLLLFGIHRLQLFDLVPVARDVLVESMADAVMVLDGQGRILDSNRAAQTLFGRSAESFIGRHASTVCNQWPVLAESMQSNVDYAGEVHLGGQPSRYLEIRISPLRPRTRQADGRLVVLRDVTARRAVEGELQSAKEAMEHAYQQLGRQLIELEERNQELDAFAHTVAHDLRNPLSQLLGYSEMLLDVDGLPSAEAQRGLKAMYWGAQKMNSIIEELLLLAQVRQADVETGVLPMEQLVRDALARLAEESQRAHTEIVLPDFSTWPLVLGYSPWVEEVWANYLSNALKYGGKPPQIVVGADVCPGNMIRFWVQDNGCGLSPEEQSRLFASFERISQIRVTGFGLGLSIVRRIVEKLGGEVGVTSAGVPGQGSVFSFTLPAAQTESTLPGRD